MYYPFSNLWSYYQPPHALKKPSMPNTATEGVDPDLGISTIRLPTSSSATVTFSDAAIPCSFRTYVRHPGVNSASLQAVQHKSARVFVSKTTNGSHAFHVEINGKTGAVATAVAEPGEWFRVEAYCASAADIGVKMWRCARNGAETLALDYHTSTATARSGTSVSSTSTFGATVQGYETHFHHLALTKDTSEIGRAKYKRPYVSEVTATGRDGVNLDGVVSGGATAGLRLAGVYWSDGVDRRYIDTAPIVAGIDAATDVPGLSAAIAPALAHQNVAVTFYDQGDGTHSVWPSPDVATVKQLSFSDPRLKPFVKQLVFTMAQIPPGLLDMDAQTTIMVGSEVYLNDTRVSGVAFTDGTTAMATNQTQFHYDTYGSVDDVAHRHVITHELGHIFEYGIPTGDPYLAAMKTDFGAANPEGFTYGQAAADAPFAGEHPLGFCRGYGRLSLVEDFADVFAYTLTPELYATLIDWMRDDPHLRAKHQSLKRLLYGRWWGQYVLEEMHGSLPQVRPL